MLPEFQLFSKSHKLSAATVYTALHQIPRVCIEIG